MVTKTIKFSRKTYLHLLDEDIKFCGLKESTAKRYRDIVTRYLDFVDNNPSFTRREIMDFYYSLGEVGSTYASWCLSIVKRFHRTIQDILPEDKKKWPLGPREGPKNDTGLQPSLKEDEIDSLLELVKSNTKDYAIVRLLFATGMRRDEVVRLKRNNYSKSNITFLMSKREETRTVRLDKETCSVLDKYLKSRNDRKEALFINDHGEPYSPEALSQVFRKYFRTLNFKKGTGFHALRRGLVSVLHNRGIPREEIQKFYGWKTSTMVDRYLQITPSEVGKMVELVHPLYK